MYLWTKTNIFKKILLKLYFLAKCQWKPEIYFLPLLWLKTFQIQQPENEYKL